MTVTMIASEPITGSEVSDSLNGGSTGLDLGQVVTGSYAPVTLQSANTGAQDLFLRHDSVVDPITDLVFYVDEFSGTYGGANSAAADFTTLTGYGSSDSGATKNNNDGLSRGLHIDMDWQVSVANQFDYSREATGNKRIFGKTYTGKDGVSFATAFPCHVDACSYWNGSTEVDATTPVTGQLAGTGQSAGTQQTLGNRVHLKKRFYLHSGATEGGVLQYDYVVAYSYTA